MKRAAIATILILIAAVAMSGCRKKSGADGGKTMPDGLNLATVNVPAGEFTYGCDLKTLCGDDEPETARRTLEAFAIMKNEVTNAEYAKCAAAGECEPNTAGLCITRREDGRDAAVAPKSFKTEFKAADHPAVCVSWEQARAFCRWAGGSLPDAYQWEKAARGGDGRIFPWGNTPPTPDSANLGQNICCRPDAADGYNFSSPPGAFPGGVSPYGANDMPGNVWEWTETLDPDTGDALARGGSWRTTPFEARASNSWPLPPSSRRDDVGFRCVF